MARVHPRRQPLVPVALNQLVWQAYQFAKTAPGRGPSVMHHRRRELAPKLRSHFRPYFRIASINRS